MKNVMLSKNPATSGALECANNARMRKHFRPCRVANRFLYASLLVGTIMIASTRMAFAQEKVKLYPNYSFQGVFGNPALFTDLGDWGYMSYNMSKEPSATFQISNQFRGVQLNGSYTSNDSWMANGSMGIGGSLNVGATFTSDNKNGVVGMTYRPIHTGKNMTQAGAQFDLGSKTAKLAAETRFPVSKSMELTVSGNVSFDNNEVKNQGFGLQWVIGKFRNSFGLSGIGKTVVDIAEQVNLGNGILPDGGVKIENGKVTGSWLGILKLF